MLVSPSWNARILAVGLGLIVAGCGGKSPDETADVPDASAEFGAAPGAMAGAEPVAAAPVPVAVAPAPAPTGGSTQEMMAMATQAPPVQAAPTAAAPAAGGPSGEMSGYGGYGGRGGYEGASGSSGEYGGQGAPQGYGAPPGSSGEMAGSPSAVAPDGYGPSALAPGSGPGASQAEMQGAVGLRGRPGGGPPGSGPAGEGYGPPEGYGGGFAGGGEVPGGISAGGPGGSGGNERPVYRSPIEAVQTYLAAVKSKNLERIADATALRSPTEANPKNQKFFKAILEQSIASDEINDLASELDGMQVVSMSQGKETSKIGVIIAKQSESEYIRRKVMVRREKAGWKVLDIEGKSVQKMPNSGGGGSR